MPPNTSTDRADKTHDVDAQLLKRVHSLENWYSREFERRLAELAEILNSELQTRAQAAQQFYEERLAQQKSPPDVEPVEAGSLQSLLEEISKAESDTARCSAELERMVADDSVALGKLLQARTKELELKAYLRGLKFLAARVPASKAD